MSKIKDVINFLIKELKVASSDSLIRAVYLADWKHCIEYQKQITNIDWFFDDCGPSSTELKTVLKERIESDDELSLTEEEYITLNHVVTTLAKTPQSQLIRLVYSTFPIISSDRYTSLNLVELAKEYTKEK
jgi:hypothetical protein